MKLRINACFIFEPTDIPSRDHMINAFNAIKPKLVNIDDLERSYITVHNCYHDVVPERPCEVLFEWVKE
jgi:hypothetical protein